MLFKTRGIVLSFVKFRETSIIVKVFTEEFGLQSYIVNSVRSARGRGKIALYQPLTLLELVVYKNDQKSIQRISEARCERAYRSLNADVKKSAIAIFWAELLSRAITSEGLEDREKFRFIRQQLVELDEAKSQLENFPVRFCVELSKHLGFQVESGLNLVNDYGHGTLVNDKELIAYFDDILLRRTPYPSDRNLRKKALGCILAYYEDHLEDFRKLRSTEILKQLFV